MKRIVLDAGDNVVKSAHRIAMAAAFNSGRSIYVDDSNPQEVFIRDYQETLAVVTAESL